MENERFDAGPALAQLKRFQRRTVDYVFDRLHGADPVRQFLVADEVGLGKTMVARGVIAKTIEALWDRSKRIDILYICSNQAIAAQNLNRLNVLGKRAMALPTRMTLVPLQLRGEQDLTANKVNFISLTPGTTFNLRSTTGVVEERALVHRLLEAMGYGAPAPGLSTDLLRLGIGYKLQENKLGGISRGTRTLLRQVAARAGEGEKGKPLPRKLTPGTRLVRDWHGVGHTVIVLEDGFEYDGKHWNSLTAIAKAITGTPWNGPLFFGLAERKKQA